MHYNHDIMTHIQRLYQYSEAQQSKIEQLESTIVDLKNDLEILKKNNSPRVEKIEYKFDQLKIERLEGTLNIGITPSGGIEPASIEDFSISRNEIDITNSTQQSPQLYKIIKNEVDTYLNSDCYNVLKQLEQDYNYHLDPSYRNFIVEDVKNQIDQRIQYYLKDISTRESSQESLKQLEQTTITNVKNDINRTLEEFIKHLPKKGEQTV